MTLTASERLDRSVSEADLQSFVAEACARYKWLYHHAGDSRRSTPGLPDVIAVRGDRLIVAELKTQHGRVSDIQNLWLTELAKCPGVETFVWRPSDMNDILRTLK